MLRLSDPWRMQHGREVVIPSSSRKTQHGCETKMSGDLQKMQYGREAMKPGGPWKMKHGHEVMSGARKMAGVHLKRGRRFHVLCRRSPGGRRWFLLTAWPFLCLTGAALACWHLRLCYRVSTGVLWYFSLRCRMVRGLPASPCQGQGHNQQRHCQIFSSSSL